MSKESQVVAIDGLRGTGKSWLATNLRLRFGCKALDIGPLFRLLAWLVDQGFAENTTKACDALSAGLDAHEIEIRLDAGGRFSASRIEVRGAALESALWDPELNPLIKNAAGSHDVSLRVAELAHRLVGFERAIVVGREVGSKVFPQALVKINLQAGVEKRLERKLTQLVDVCSNLGNEFALEHSEPQMTWASDAQGAISIDTTNLCPEEVVEIASSYIASKLGWESQRTLQKEDAVSAQL